MSTIDGITVTCDTTSPSWVQIILLVIFLVGSVSVGFYLWRTRND